LANIISTDSLRMWLPKAEENASIPAMHIRA
jgi:hypothetical protein